MRTKLYTIGHSNHTIDTFIGLLQQHGVTALADVRSHPFSRYLPHFCQGPLKLALTNAHIQYVFLGQELGARPDDPTCYINNKAIYEQIAATSAFTQGIKRIITGTHKFQIALMCAEKDPANCHRAILICQHLTAYPININHILSNGKLESHQCLEKRILKLHKLDQPVQLGLFGASKEDVTMAPPASATSATPILTDPYSLETTIKQAYQLQGHKIAYQEKNNEPTD